MLSDKFTPVNLGLRKFIDHTLDVARRVASASRLRSSKHGFFELILDSLTFFWCHWVRTTVALAILIIFTIFTIALAIVAIHMVIKQLVKQIFNVDLLGILDKVSIDLFKVPIFILAVMENWHNRNFLTKIILETIRINHIVHCDIGNVTVITTTTVHMVIGTMKQLMTEQEHHLVSRKFNDKFAIIEEVATIGSGSGQPTVSVLKGKTHGKIAKERLLKHKGNTGFKNSLTCCFVLNRINCFAEFASTLFDLSHNCVLQCL